MGVVIRAVLVLSNPRRVPVVVVQPKIKKKGKKKKLNDNDIPSLHIKNEDFKT